MLETRLTIPKARIETTPRAMLQRLGPNIEVDLNEMMILLADFLRYLGGTGRKDPTYIAVYRWVLNQFEQTEYGKRFLKKHPKASQVLEAAYENNKPNQGDNGFNPQPDFQQQPHRLVEWLSAGKNGDGQYDEVLAWLRER